MTVKELYYATQLIGPLCLSYGTTDIYGQEINQEKIYPTGTDLHYDFKYIGDYKVIAIQAIRGQLELTIEKP